MTDLEQACESNRITIQAIGDAVKSLNKHPECIGEVGQSAEQWELCCEMLANLTLAYRHLEDACMRLGKVMQAIQGGVSILDKPEVRKAAYGEGQ